MRRERECHIVGALPCLPGGVAAHTCLLPAIRTGLGQACLLFTLHGCPSVASITIPGTSPANHVCCRYSQNGFLPDSIKACICTPQAPAVQCAGLLGMTVRHPMLGSAAGCLSFHGLARQSCCCSMRLTWHLS